MQTTAEDMDEIVFWENFKLSLKDIQDGKTVMEEYDWGGKGQNGV